MKMKELIENYLKVKKQIADSVNHYSKELNKIRKIDDEHLVKENIETIKSAYTNCLTLIGTTNSLKTHWPVPILDLINTLEENIKSGLNKIMSFISKSNTRRELKNAIDDDVTRDIIIGLHAEMKSTFEDLVPQEFNKFQIRLKFNQALQANDDSSLPPNPPPSPSESRSPTL